MQRNLPLRGVRPAYYLLGVFLVTSYGWYKAGQGMREKKYDYRPRLRISWPRRTKTAVADRDRRRAVTLPVN